MVNMIDNMGSTIPENDCELSSGNVLVLLLCLNTPRGFNSAPVYPLPTLKGAGV